MVHLLHSLGAYLCIVGDDDQTIYQWRGSDITNIRTFATRYPDVKQIRLQENFRSSKGIIETARDFIKQNAERLPKAMVSTDAQQFDVGDIVALSFENPHEEARYIASNIKQLKGVAFKEDNKERGLSYSDCAILLRSVKNNADPIVSVLREEGIPAIIVGMKHLFDTLKAQAARLIFYYLAGRNAIDKKTLRDEWLKANIGINNTSLNRAIEKLQDTKD
jgi:DNA helicase-2/ATP-dependent DNA helicase PcrA